MNRARWLIVGLGLIVAGSLFAGGQQEKRGEGGPVPGRKNWPLLFDEHHCPKEAFWAVAKW